MKTKRLLMILTALALCCAMLPVCAEKETVQLGTSCLYMELPEGYVLAETEEEEYLVGYYWKDDESVDFDVYQWEKEGKTLEEAAAEDAAEYDAVPEIVMVNGLDGMLYVSIEEYEGVEYTVLNYILDAGEHFVELCFWTDGIEEDNIAVEEMLLGVFFRE